MAAAVVTVRDLPDPVDWIGAVPDPRPEVVDLLAAAWVSDDPAAAALLRGSRRWSTPAERAAARALAAPVLAGLLTAYLADSDQVGAWLRDHDAP